jgi:phosphate transport system substrate-binding protein
MKRFFLTLLILLFSALSGHSAENELIGAGATFPQPFYSKLSDVYFEKTGIKVNYQGVGSGSGINLLIDRVVDFAGSDAYMTEEEMKKAPSPVSHIPTCIGAVVISYNLPGNPEIRLTPDLVSDIFLGKIKRWNDSRILTLNKGVTLPDMPIIIVRRSDSSGTTFVFSEYLSKVSKEWKEKMGTAKSLNWPPEAVGQKGNSGVAGFIRQTPGALGYVELTYAIQNRMAYATLKNKSGNFIKPTLDSVSSAAKVKIPDDTNISLTDTPAKDGYPISSFTWIIFYKDQNYGGRSKQRAINLKNFLTWLLNEGQSYAKPLHYSPLPAEAQTKARKIVDSMTYANEPLTK